MTLEQLQAAIRDGKPLLHPGEPFTVDLGLDCVPLDDDDFLMEAADGKDVCVSEEREYADITPAD
jgi:hypothetical protein